MKSVNAMITWTPDREPFLENGTRGRVEVIHHNVEHDDKNITHSVGSCDAGWEELGVAGREAKINEIYKQMVEEDNINPAYAKKQLSRIEDAVIN
ncbi:hypothetical protein [Brucella pseudogrignonensis]|uniref:hypothetical protein n=1 Tax=Brucella pseudogrignonensis TaxID=419475 RepID=UPI000CFB711F|nr:hypothetical protein [Brucella pseudogrignonensis]MQP39615.1 hypothetical protein [Ochrobactrum sp. MYb237]PQZ42631.1 hypothetical protein CQ059_01285 [Brucella pseudogrignonensis]PRA42060.1 hypothetical protein CQ063_08650 [Brucella pseudogrignonensis]PRA70514.1 hypothetical protein CQ055_06350 [Brucella pseudogrignonensis]